MKTIVLVLRWISLPFVFLLVLFLVTGGLNFITKMFNHGQVSDNLIMMIASGFGSYFSVKACFYVAPSRNNNVLFSICGFILFFYGMAFWNSFIKEDYNDIWGYVGNIAGLVIIFLELKSENKKEIVHNDMG